MGLEQRVTQLEAALCEACDTLESACTLIEGEDITDEEEIQAERDRIVRLRDILRNWPEKTVTD